MTNNENSYPDNFYKGISPGNGSCFFDSFRQSLEQQKGVKVTVEQLRKDCQEFVQKNPTGWVERAIFNKPGKDGQPLCHDVDSYKESIPNNNEWGDPEVEGRILCQKYKVKLHLIEEQSCYMDLLGRVQREMSGELPKGTNKLYEIIMLGIVNSYTGQESDSKKTLVGQLTEIISQEFDPQLSEEAHRVLNLMEEFSNISNTHRLISSASSLSLDNPDYNDQNTIHIINDGMSHFEPLLDRNRDLIEQPREEQDDHLIARELQEQEQNDYLVARDLQEREDYLLAKEFQVDEILEYCGKKKDDPRREEVQKKLDELLIKNPNKSIVDIIKQCIDFVKQHIFKPSSSIEKANSTSICQNKTPLLRA